MGLVFKCFMCLTRRVALQGQTMPSPNYIDGQSEITWDMRATLIDWLLQVHLRYHLLPETLWIAINIVDRFLSKRVVSLVKLQLVGVTAMYIAAKYEEIIAPRYAPPHRSFTLFLCVSAVSRNLSS